MSRTLGVKDMKNILYGATFFGGGGGGRLSDGLKMLDECIAAGKTEIKLFEPDEMGENEYAVSVAGLGSPIKLTEYRFGPEASLGFKTMQNLMMFSGKKLNYSMAGELGGLNTMVPMWLAAMDGIPFVDGDGNGRAVPELNTTLYDIFEVPPMPLVLTSRYGDIITAYINNPKDQKAAENIARYMCMAYNMSIAFTTWVVSSEDIKTKLAPGSITLSEKVGIAFSKAKEEKLDIIDELKKLIECREIFRGKIKRVEINAVGGFDVGTAILEGAGKFNGQSVSLYYQNENLMVKDASGNAILAVPEVITLIELDMVTPLTNADTKEGMNVSLVGAPAPSNWWKSPKGFGVWKEALERAGYTGGPVKY